MQTQTLFSLLQFFSKVSRVCHMKADVLPFLKKKTDPKYLFNTRTRPDPKLKNPSTLDMGLFRIQGNCTAQTAHCALVCRCCHPHFHNASYGSKTTQCAFIGFPSLAFAFADVTSSPPPFHIFVSTTSPHF